MKLGVTLSSLGSDVKEAIGNVSRTGLAAIDVDAVHGPVTPELSHSGRRDFLRYVGTYGLEVRALCGDFGRGFSDEGAVERLFDETEKLIGLALDLRVRIITTGIGRAPEDETGRAHGRLREVLNEIGKRAENYDIRLASHVDESTPADLKKMLDSLNTQGIKVCYDPSILMPRGLDAVSGVRELGGYIVHAYARDVLKGERGYAETMPGEGIVPFRDYVLALCEIGYAGHLVVKRGAGAGGVEDAIKAREFLERIII